MTSKRVVSTRRRSGHEPDRSTSGRTGLLRPSMMTVKSMHSSKPGPVYAVRRVWRSGGVRPDVSPGSSNQGRSAVSGARFPSNPVQPPGPQKATNFAPLRGRKVLVFSIPGRSPPPCSQPADVLGARCSPRTDRLGIRTPAQNRRFATGSISRTSTWRLCLLPRHWASGCGPS